jgi:predicted nucleic-acid-binding protein
MLEESGKILTEAVWVETKKKFSSRETILEVLARAADDHKFLARLAENPSKVLQEYALTEEERAALARGDIEKIESLVGKLDNRLKTWLRVRLAQDKW